MAKHKRSGRRPQPQHSRKSKRSRHDKRRRLSIPNPRRQRTVQASVSLTGGIASMTNAMAQALDNRIGFRLMIVVAGAMLAKGRRTAASWFRCAGVRDDWDVFYSFLQSVGRSACSLALPLLKLIVRRFDPGEEGYWTLAIDDSPTKRFGRHVEAANTHHNPTPGPADSQWLYGHNWVCLAMLRRHPLGTIALPLMSRLYVRKVDIRKLRERHKGWKFRTKHELALELLEQTMGILRGLGSKARVAVVFDGAYAVAKLIRPLIAQGATVVTRLRRDAALFDLPPELSGKRGRGRPAKYGKNRISLAKRAGHREGWTPISYSCRGVTIEACYKTFLATSEVFGGTIRVVLLQYDSGNWAAYASSDPSMSVEAILGIVSDRWAIEECFHDMKEIWGAGEQQVRNVWSNIGCWNLCGWLYAMVELESWELPAEQLVDRSDRPWDNPDRRPSHADKRRRIAREMLRNEFSAALGGAPEDAKIQHQFERLLALAA